MANTKVTETIREVLNILKEDVKDRWDKVMALIIHKQKKEDWWYSIGAERVRINQITLDDMIQYKEIVNDVIDWAINDNK